MEFQNYILYLIMGFIALLIVIGFWGKIGGFL
jgi:hypothetical protein